MARGHPLHRGHLENCSEEAALGKAKMARWGSPREVEEENITGVKAVGQQGRKDQEVHVGGLKGHNGCFVSQADGQEKPQHLSDCSPEACCAGTPKKELGLSPGALCLVSVHPHQGGAGRPTGGDSGICTQSRPHQL